MLLKLPLLDAFQLSRVVFDTAKRKRKKKEIDKQAKCVTERKGEKCGKR